MKAIVIGAGVAGLASAARLAALGYEVEVMENNAYPGGKLSEFSLGAYRFDAGPSLFTMPEILEETFAFAGQRLEDFFEYERLDTITHYFYEDGTRLTATADPRIFAAEIEQKLGVKADKILHFLDKSRQKYDLTAEIFLRSSLHKWTTYTKPQTLKAVMNVGALELFRTMNAANEAFFDHQPHLTQLFNRYATYNGSDPYQTPATMNIIPHLEFNMGAYFPKKGMFSITESLVALCNKLGVRIHFNTPIERIVVENNRVKGVSIKGSFVAADLVVSNMDVVNTYRRLLPDRKHPELLLRQARSSSALIFYWGINRQFPELDLHNIFFSKDYRAEFAAIFQQKTVFNDPTVYINISSKRKPDDAPPHGENWFTMVNVPDNSGQNWAALTQQVRQAVLDKLSRILQTPIEPLIEQEALLDPLTIESRTASVGGALYGTSSNNRYAAFLRHANFSSNIRQLYFCGGSVHPGGGIPLCLLSAKIVGDLVAEQ
jgi:phytoene desaturase